jgi:hypothetical protein
MDSGFGGGYVFVICAIVAVIVWALFAIGTQGTKSEKEIKTGDKLSGRGVVLVQAFFWIVVVIGFIAVISSSD